MLGAPGPSLKVDATGKVVEKKGLTLNGNTRNLNDVYTSGEIVVDDIRNDNSLNGNRAEFTIATTGFDLAKPSGSFSTSGVLVGRPEFTFVTASIASRLRTHRLAIFESTASVSSIRRAN